MLGVGVQARAISEMQEAARCDRRVSFFGEERRKRMRVYGVMEKKVRVIWRLFQCQRRETGGNWESHGCVVRKEKGTGPSGLVRQPLAAWAAMRCYDVRAQTRLQRGSQLRCCAWLGVAGRGK